MARACFGAKSFGKECKKYSLIYFISEQFNLTQKSGSFLNFNLRIRICLRIALLPYTGSFCLTGLKNLQYILHCGKYKNQPLILQMDRKSLPHR